MSRTEIYKIMENQIIDLPLGNNVLDHFTNGAGFLGNLSNKFYCRKFDLNSEPVEWLTEFTDVDNQGNQISGTYSLDCILEGKVPDNILLTTEVMDDSSVISPLSNSDDSSYDLDDILNFSVSPDAILESDDSSLSPLEEHVYGIASPMTYETVPSPVLSDDSGFQSSGEDSVTDTDDLLSQLLSGSYDFNAIEVASRFSHELTSSIDNSSLAFNFAESTPKEEIDSREKINKRKTGQENKVSISRPAPYKKKKEKTAEQKLRKKAQNRNAAIRYRSKKNNELDQMFAEAGDLETKNKELRGKVDGLINEINYLKNLMLDVIKARLSSGGAMTVSILNS